MLTEIQERVQTIRSPQTMKLSDLMNLFEGISLKEMDRFALMNRVDTKFVFSKEQLFQVLASIKDNYWALDIHGVRLNHYRTLYFDTENFHLYHEHVNHGINCYKVRAREYVESELAFLEVKFKNQKKRTIKNRISTDTLVYRMEDRVTGFMGSNYPFDVNGLEAKLWNTFTRITLVSKTNLERLTIDINLAFSNGSREKKFDIIVIAEVKQDGFSHNSDFMQHMRRLGVRKTGFSKYCMGVSLFYDHVKKNALKPKLLMVNKMQKGVLHG